MVRGVCVYVLSRFLQSKHILVEKLNKYIWKSTGAGAKTLAAHTLGECRNGAECTLHGIFAGCVRSGDDDDLPQASKSEQRMYSDQEPGARVKTFNCQKYIQQRARATHTINRNENLRIWRKKNNQKFYFRAHIHTQRPTLYLFLSGALFPSHRVRRSAQ